MAEARKSNEHGHYSSEQPVFDNLVSSECFEFISQRMREVAEGLDEAGKSAELFQFSKLPEPIKEILPRSHDLSWLKRALNSWMEKEPAFGGYQVSFTRLSDRNVTNLDDGIYRLKRLKRGLISDAPSTFKQLQNFVSKMRDRPEHEQVLALETLKGLSWVERVSAGDALYADVKIPTDAPVLWQDSSQKQKVDDNSQSLDAAIPEFTAEVYQDYLPGQCAVGLTIADFKGLDKCLYDEWLALRKRLNAKNARLKKNGETEVPWQDDWPFQSPAARTDHILQGLRAGELLPPRSQKFYHSLKGALSNRHQVNLDDFLVNSMSMTPR